MQEKIVVAEAELPQKFVVFALPSFTKNTALETFQSAVQTEWLLGKEKISSAYRFVGGDQFVAKARNRLATEFFTEFPPTATDFFFIDDDIGWPAEKILEFINSPEAVVCGVYPKKKNDTGVLVARVREIMKNPDSWPDEKIKAFLDQPVDWPCTLEAENGRFVRNESGYYSAILAPCGFMRVKRWFLEALVKDRRLYQEDNGDGTMGARFNLFEAGFLPHWDNWSGEDFDFCQKVRKLGEKVWVDADITFAHRGTYKWEGNLAYFMAMNESFIDKRISDAMEALEAEKAKEAA